MSRHIPRRDVFEGKFEDGFSIECHEINTPKLLAIFTLSWDSGRGRVMQPSSSLRLKQAERETHMSSGVLSE